ncbi:MAG: hypothetical protein WDM94_04540 [Bauldia sp.]
MQTASVNVVDLDTYRNRRRSLQAAQAYAAPMPVAWVVVWFAPVVFVQPYANYAQH